MTDEDVCDRITTKEDCEAAATNLGLPVTTASVVSHLHPDTPPYCYFKQYMFKRLYFNTAFTGTAACSNKRNCLCKSGKIVPISGENQLLPDESRYSEVILTL